MLWMKHLNLSSVMLRLTLLSLLAWIWNDNGCTEKRLINEKLSLIKQDRDRLALQEWIYGQIQEHLCLSFPYIIMQRKVPFTIFCVSIFAVKKQRKNYCIVLYIIKLIIIETSSKLYINMLQYESLINFTIRRDNLENIQDI